MKLNSKQYSEEGYPLLILHGLLGNLGNWGWHSRELARDFAVIGLDLRNHGESPHSDHMGYSAMAADVLEYMDEQGIEKAHLLGHSMGGKVAMQLALEAPHRVARLVVADIAPVDYPAERRGANGASKGASKKDAENKDVANTKEASDKSASDKSVSHDTIFEALGSLRPAELSSRKEADEILSRAIANKGIRQFLLTNLQRADEGGYRWRMNLPALERSYASLRAAPVGEHSFDGEVLFIKGALSAYIQEKHREQILARFPRARVKVILEAGHWLHAEKPQSFYTTVHDFLTESGPGVNDSDDASGDRS